MTTLDVQEGSRGVATLSSKGEHRRRIRSLFHIPFLIMFAKRLH
jgi:hypothetical protein